MTTPNLNQLAPISDFDNAYVLAQQAHEQGFRGSTFADLYLWLKTKLDVLGLSNTAGLPEEFPQDGDILSAADAGQWTILGPGTYHQPGYPSIEVAEGKIVFAQFDGTQFSIQREVEMPMQDVSGKVDKSEVTVSGATHIPLYENLFDKNTMVLQGFSLSTSGGGIEPNATTTCTELIPVNPDYPIYALRGWTGTPSYIHLYGADGDFLRGKSLGAAFKDGVLDSNPDKDVYYVRANIYSSTVVGSDEQSNIDSFMVYSGPSLIQDYKPYVGFFNSIEGKSIVYDYEQIEAGMTLIEKQQNREMAYSKPISFTPKNSRLDENSFIKNGYIGDWLIRPDGTTVVDMGDYFRISTDGSVVNLGLLYTFLFMPTDIGKTLYFDFEARSISGYGNLNLYAASSQPGSFVTINMNNEWTLHKGSVLVGSQNLGGDYRLLLGIPGFNEATFDIRNINLYFVAPSYPDEPTDSGVIPESFGDMPVIKNKLNLIKNGVNTSLVIGICGDSWTDHVPGSIMYARDLSRLLRSEYGDGGGGFYDFAENAGSDQKHACIDPLDANDSRSGTITYFDSLPEAKWVNVNHSLFSQGSSITLNVTRAHTKLVIHYYGGAEYGSFTYSVDGDAPVTIDTSLSTGHQTIELNVSDTTHTLEFNITTGNVIIFGVDMQRQYGVRVHKLGNRGLHAYHYTIVNETDFEASFASLGLDAVTLLIGTNDRTASRPTASFKQYLQKFVDMVKSTDEYIDFLMISPSNNGYTDSERTPMIEYVKQQVAVSIENDLSFLSLLPLFGSSQKIVDKGLFSDIVHPTTNMGEVIAKKIFLKLTT